MKAYDATFLLNAKFVIFFFQKISYLAENRFSDDQIYIKVSQNVQYLWKNWTNFNKWGFKWKLMILASY